MRWTVPAAYIIAFFAGIMAFRRFRPVRAMLLVMIGGWLFLPTTEILPTRVFGPTKLCVIELTVLVGMLVAGRERVKWPRAKWWDLAMVAWVLMPAVSELVNDLGWDAVGAALVSQIIVWGIPYLIGRIFLRDLESFNEAGVILVAGAVVMVPLALYESVFRPPMHEMVYGNAVLSNDPLMPLILNRWGPMGYRPSLFLHEGPLAVSFYYAAAAILMVMVAGTRQKWLKRRGWLWGTAAVLVIMPFGLRPFVGMIVLIVGLGVVGVCAMFNARWPLVLVLLVPLAYIGARATGFAQLGEGGYVHLRASPELPQNYMGKNYSMWSRWFGEDVILAKVAQRPEVGWGSQVRREWLNTGIEKLSNFDSLWTYALARNGWAGETALWLAWLVACGLGMRAMKGRSVRDAELVGLFGLLMVVMLHGVDWLMNCSICPIWIACMGGFVTAGAEGLGPRVILE